MSTPTPGYYPQNPPNYYPQRRKSRWWMPLLIIGIIIVLILIIFGIIIGTVGSMFEKEPIQVKESSVLYINFGTELPDYSFAGPFDFLDQGKKNSLFDVITAIHKAKDDTRIMGIYYKANSSVVGWAMSEEFIEAIKDFKQSGKFVYAYMDYGSESDYMRASVADKVYMSNEALIEMNGFAIASMFMKGLFDKIGIDFLVDFHEDFKSAGESYVNKKFTDSSKYQLKVILDQRLEQFVNIVAENRNLSPDLIKQALNRGIYTPDSLLALGFIDSLINEVSLKDMIKAQIYGAADSTDEKKLKLVSVSNYVNSVPTKEERTETDRDNQIAIVFASGAITAPSGNIFESETNITSEAFISNLKKAVNNKKVSAVIIRVNSPGGSVLVSDEIYSAILKAKEKKPIYCSMSSVAASGGYYIASACDKIVASPSTLTGSIGVISMIPNLNGLLKKLYITIDTISTGPSAQDLNMYIPYTQRQKDKLHTLSQAVYFRFIDKVAKSRNKTFDEVRAIAKGRVWSGTDAYRIGLVDTLGGLQTTIALVKKDLGIPQDTKVKLQTYPRADEGLNALLKLLGLNEEDEDAELAVYQKNNISELLNQNQSEFKKIYSVLPNEMKPQVAFIWNLIQNAKYENVQMVSPNLLEIK
ncbi:MAG TPA: signal peptide peptidase SppA [Candidatus Kapabacteria bacterium]|nr:signal peptide peptidase SppA [Candidatus Kapabacteria bacterium]